MNPARPANPRGCREDNGAAAARGIANWLCLAATPTFAVMAMLTAILGGGPMGGLCSANEGFRLDGMVPMYLLMSAFHSHHWLNLISTRQ